MNGAVGQLDADVAAWFTERHGDATAIQAQSWPAILAGRNVLATAPTGSGKTLCAFLVPIQHLLTGHWSPGAVRVLYISPLKALNNDIQRNLVEPLAELSERLREAGRPVPAVRVATRSGDTDPAERRRMHKHPPEILITTPESLNILLTSASGRAMLASVRMAILDEIHAVAGNRRGLWLMAGIEALAELAGEFQRVALSATVRPLEDVARLVAGHGRAADGSVNAATRSIDVLRSASVGGLDLQVRSLGTEPLPGDGGLDAIGPIADEVARATQRNRSTLVFANSRALCEKLAMRTNERAGVAEPLAWAHHGSLSRELRHAVEGRLKAGDLRAIVATSSLEMGIDIGSLDEVLMVQAPPGVASAVQRAGRAGHGVGETSRATLLPTHPQDALQCAVIARAALSGDIEATRLPGPALDVLTQMIIVRLAIAPRTADALHDAIRTATPYRNLPRDLLDGVLAMLLGRFGATRVRELSPRLLEDPDTGMLRLRRGTLLALYGAGGMIPDRGYYQLRHAESGARLGELDEEFVWENGPGRTFSFGNQQWRVQRVTHDDVLVTPAPDAAFAPPFWRAEDRDRDGHLSQRLGEFLADADAALTADDADALDALFADYPVDDATRDAILEHLRGQRAHTERALPHARHLLCEHVHSGPQGYAADGGQLVLHSLAGGAVNRPLAMILAARWRQQFGSTPELFASNDCVVVQGAADVPEDTLRALLDPRDLELLLREELEESGAWGARFRESAGRALLLGRRRIGGRTPLWMHRLAAQRLLARVQPHPDFPMRVEAWRSCLEEQFDLDGLQARLTAIADGELRLDHCRTSSPSPFAAASGWRQVNEYMYADDRPRQRAANTTSQTLVAAAVGDARLRPRVERAIAERFTQRRRRLVAGWGPADADELRAWLRERRVLRREEFDAHCERLQLARPQWAIAFDANDAGTDAGRLLVDRTDAADARRVFGAAADTSTEPGTESERGALRSTWLLDLVEFEGVFTETDLRALLPEAAPWLPAELERLVDGGALIAGALTSEADDDAVEYCASEAFEAMLRLQRQARRPTLQALPAARAAEFIAQWQRVGCARDLVDAVEPLRARPLPAEVWESALLPARLAQAGGAQPASGLDELLASGALVITGAGTASGRREDLQLCSDDELDLLERGGGDDEAFAQLARRIEQAFPDPAAHYDFDALLTATGEAADTSARLLWDAIFAGLVGCESWSTIRHGIATQFSLPAAAPAASDGGAGRGLRARIRARVHGVPGRFRRLPLPVPDTDPVLRIERDRQRARIVLERWGVVCPALLAGEAPAFRFGRVFRALRLMELAGEVTTGHFLDGLDGPQFATPDAVAALREFAGRSSEAMPTWFDARDPAAALGCGLPAVGAAAPARRAGNELVRVGPRIALVSERGGDRLQLDEDCSDALRDAAIEAFARSRRLRGLGAMTVTHINDAKARGHMQLDHFATAFDIRRDHRALTFEARGQ